MGQTRAADRRDGLGRSVAPLNSKETEDCQGRSAARSPCGPWATEGDGARVVRRLGPKPPSPGVPSVATPLLAGQATEGMDSATLRFLIASALRRKKKEEEDEERKQELEKEALDDKLEAEMDALMAIDPERLTSRQEARLSAILPERAELIERKRRAARKTRRKKKLLRSGCNRRRRRQWHDCCAGFADSHTPRVVFPVVDDWPEMFDIMAAMDQKDSIPRVWCGHRRLRQWHVQGWYCWYFRCVPFCCRQAQMLGIMASMIQKDCYEATLLQFINEVMNIPVVAQRLLPMVQTVLRTLEIPQLLVDKVVDAPVLQVSQVYIISVVTQRQISMIRLFSKS